MCRSTPASSRKGRGGDCTRLGAKRSGWNAADIRGESERLVASVGVVAERPVRIELVEDIAHRARAQCAPLLTRDDVPEHVRSLTSERVLTVEADLVDSITVRSTQLVTDENCHRGLDHLDPAQRRVVSALAGEAGLLAASGSTSSTATGPTSATTALPTGPRPTSTDTDAPRSNPLRDCKPQRCATARIADPSRSRPPHRSPAASTAEQSLRAE